MNKLSFQDGKGFFIRDHAPPNVRRILKKHGGKEIAEIYVCRTVVQHYIRSLLNILSFGKFNKAIEESNFEDIYHLFIYIRLKPHNHYFRMEKNQVVEIKKSFKVDTHGDCHKVALMSNFAAASRSKGKIVSITLQQLFDNAEIYQRKKMNTNLWHYRPATNNCQIFVNSLLSGNRINNPTLSRFILQDAKSLFKKSPYYLTLISNWTVDTGAALDKIIYGKGL